MIERMEPLKIGLTGGIGSGKSTVCRIFELLNVPTYNSDVKAKELIHTHSTLVELYKSYFGEDVFEGGSLDTKKVSQILFKKPDVLQAIQKVVHPIVRSDFSAWAHQQNSPWVINEAAVLFEGGSFVEMDLMITVVAPAELRLSRVMKRSGLSKSEVQARMDNQWNDEKKVDLSDFVIYADDQQLVIPQVLEIYNKLLKRVL